MAITYSLPFEIRNNLELVTEIVDIYIRNIYICTIMNQLFGTYRKLTLLSKKG